MADCGQFQPYLERRDATLHDPVMKQHLPRLAARAIIVHERKLLLVNAYPASRSSDLWCAPGGGIETGKSLPDNLKREVYEETGLQVLVGNPALVNEFHDPKSGFHQVEIFFRCTIISGTLDPEWHDPEGIVTKRRFFTRDALQDIRLKPDSLPEIAFSPDHACIYDALEEIVG